MYAQNGNYTKQKFDNKASSCLHVSGYFIKRNGIEIRNKLQQIEMKYK